MRVFFLLTLVSIVGACVKSGNDPWSFKGTMPMDGQLIYTN